MRKFPKMSRHAQAQAGARSALEDGKPELADYIIESYEDLKLYNTVKKDMHKTLLGTERHSTDAVTLLTVSLAWCCSSLDLLPGRSQHLCSPGHCFCIPIVLHRFLGATPTALCKLVTVFALVFIHHFLRVEGV